MAKSIEISELKTRSKSAKSSTEKKKKKKKEAPEPRVRKKTSDIVLIEPDAKKKKKIKITDEDIYSSSGKKKSSKDTNLSKEAKREKKRKKLKAQAGSMEGQLEVLIQENPNVKEHDQFQEYVYIFDSLRDIARIKEEQCRGNKAQSKDVYALMKVYDQMRDVIADIRALRDISQVADQITDDVLAPFAQTSASILMDFYQSVEQLCRRNLNDDQITPFIKQIKMYAKGSGVSLQGAYEVSNQKTLEVLSDQ